MPTPDAARDQRPSPEALLAEAQQETRGRLKIFLGAAAGVGKTYEMLLAAQARRREGVDVVIGIVETHGRRETDALLIGLEVIPRRSIEYKGHWLTELDLDAVLARRPKVALIDELAHTNVPGSRHPKRYMDVVELLDAGIDVYTTLNIQHVESLNDIVAQITRIRVRETLPDSIVDRADEIEIVDITPEELIERLHAGKVYVPETARRAIRHYFSPGNLTALRELALRRTAQRVDEQLLTHMQAHAIAGPWAAGARVLVCVREDPRSLSLVRHARQLADSLHAPWTALYVETPRHHHLSDVERDRIAACLRLADQLGGKTLTVPGSGVVDEVAAYAQANNVTHIIVGKASRPRWFEMLHGSVVHDLVRRAGQISVLVMAGEDEDTAATPATTRSRPKERDAQLLPYMVALAAVVVAVAVSFALRQFLNVGNLALVFISAITFVAARFGLAPSLFACVVGSLALNFFFLPPLYRFTIADPENVVALAFFLAVAVFVSNLAAQTRSEVFIARRRAKVTAELYSFSKKLAGIIDMDDLLWATAHQIASMLKVHVLILLPEADRVVVRAGFPPEDELDESDLAAAKWSWEHDRPAGRGSDTLPGGKRLFLPLRTARGVVGVIGIDSEVSGPLFTPDERRLLEALLDQAAVSIERIRLAEDVDKSRITAETERLRSSLLTSVSHDLRTPLASILGAASSLKAYGSEYSQTTRDELVTIEHEAERLNQFVANLLDTTRLESGSLDIKKELTDIEEIVGSALQRAGKVLADHSIAVDLAPDLPMLPLDGVLLEQTLFNLLDNAAKYAPAGTRIAVRAKLQDDIAVIQVIDEGPGIPPQDLGRLFDKFYRLAAGDRQRAGTGLGLSICRGFVEAMGGRIAAGNRTDRPGAVFTITFPIGAAAETLPLKEEGSIEVWPQGRSLF